MKPVDSRHLSGSKLSAWFSDTAKKQAFSRSAWLEMGGVETNNPTTAAYHFISYKGKKGEIPPGINFAFSTTMFYDKQIPPGSSLFSYLEVPGRSYGVNEPLDEELLSLKGPTAPMAEPAVSDETVANDTSVHLIDSQFFCTNSQTPNPMNDSSFSYPPILPFRSHPCEGEIQTRLLLSSSSDSDASQAPNTRHLASVLSPQPLECLYDVFNSTADIEMIPAEYNGELNPDFGSGVHTTPRAKHPSSQEFFTPEIQLLPDCAVISTEGITISAAPSLRDPTYSPPAVNTPSPPAVSEEPIGNDTLIHITGSHILGTNSQTPIPINDSFSLPIPSGSQLCEGEIQTRLLLISSSDSDASQAPNTRHLASVLSPQPLECLYDVFNSTADIEMVPAEANGKLNPDFGSGIDTKLRAKHPSAQEFFTPEIQLLPDCAVISTAPEGKTISPAPTLRDLTYSPPAVNTQFPPSVNIPSPAVNTPSPTVNTQFLPSVDTQFQPAVNTQFLPSVDTQFPSAVNTQSFPSVDTQFSPAVNTQSLPCVDTQFPPAVNSQSLPAVATVSLTESPVSSQHTTSDIQLREEAVFSLQDSPEDNSLHKFTFSPSSLLQSYHDITSGSNDKARSYFSEKELAFLRKYDQISF